MIADTIKAPTGNVIKAAPTARRRRPAASRISAVLLILTAVVMLAPFIWTALSVTKPTDVAFANPPVLTGYTPTLKAFQDLWETTYFAQYLINTIVVAVLSTIVALVLGIPAAYALSRFPGYVSAILLLLALVFRSLPRFSVVLPMYEISKSLGIYDTTFALAAALVAINQPFSIWLLRNFFAEIPKELDEAAMIDGCTRLGTLRRVMIPLMKPGILTAGIFVFLFAFQEYLTALVLTDTSSKTVPVFITTQLGQTLPMLQQAGAAAMLLTLPVIAISFVAQKYLVAGLSDGSVKG
ncbi:MAG TPA: carbohydrate ABC transporter permease [Arthrobacter sp.]|jgi:multiple sugar transport system permease protein|nr:carbohydrate ABC transporter permease [Arthrobacter sp.]